MDQTELLKRRFSRFCLFLASTFTFCGFAHANLPSYFETPRTKVEIFEIPSSASLPKAPAGFQLGIHFELKKGWHIYWKNPGDSGTAPRIEILDPPQSTCLPLEFLTPERIIYGPLTTYGFSEETLLTTTCNFTSKPPETLRFRIAWLVCEETCIPESNTFELNTKLTNQNWPRWQERVARAEKSRPKTLTEKATYDIQGNSLYLSVPIPDQANRDSYFFPENQGFINANAKQVWSNHNGSLLGKVGLDDSVLNFSKDLSGVLVAGKNSFDFHATRSTIQIPAEVTFSWWIFYLAFVGGLLLNLMPCVFPVLSLKIMALTGSHADKEHGQFRDSLFYSLGVMATVLSMGGTLLLLKLGGYQSGWGMQLQQPVFVMFLYFLFLSMGLYFLGVWEFKGTLLSPLVRLLEKGSRTSSFLNGILTTLVATPCTAPFMGVSLGVAFVLPVFQALLVFFALGLGLCFPILLLGIYPRALSFLPRPGKWMETLKKVLSFPLLATCLWLLWVLEGQTSLVTVGITLANTLVLVFAIRYFSQINESTKSRMQWLSVSIVITVLVVASIAFSRHQPTSAVPSGRWSSFSVEQIASWEKSGDSYFVDFTARWCITCQVNKKLVLEQDDIQALFQKQGVYLMRADWTNQDPEITTLLNRYGRAGVPMYLYKRAGTKEARVLPEVLTKSIVQKYLEGEIK